MEEDLTKEQERVDDLQYKGLRLIQNPKKFCFGTDAVLLAAFADIRKNDQVVDLGTGTGIIPILLAGRTEYKHCVGVELQQEIADMAQRSIQLNGLEQRIEIINRDLKEIKAVLPNAAFDCAVCNPPYKKAGSGIIREDDTHAISRFEIACTLEDVIKAAAYLLRNGGRLSMIHQSDRMMDIITAMRKENIEPKRLRLVQPKADKPANLILIEGVKQGKPHCKWEPTLCMTEDNGKFTKEMDKIYHRGEYADG